MNGTSKRNGVEYIRARIERRLTTEVALTIAISLLLILATGILFFRVDRELDPDLGKDWWTLAFDSRDSLSLDFVIENHSEAHSFKYTVTSSDMVIGSDSFPVASGTRQVVQPDIHALPGRTTITVTGEDGTKKEIYRQR
ncbi:MAG: hypothetical protein HGB34_01560 [Candidatus Moranbacteria bacterium]|nr:hypothetical protein [Candidatus Moranbacteria bacterium]